MTCQTAVSFISHRFISLVRILENKPGRSICSARVSMQEPCQKKQKADKREKVTLHGLVDVDVNVWWSGVFIFRLSAAARSGN